MRCIYRSRTWKRHDKEEEEGGSWRDTRSLSIAYGRQLNDQWKCDRLWKGGRRKKYGSVAGHGEEGNAKAGLELGWVRSKLSWVLTFVFVRWPSLDMGHLEMGRREDELDCGRGGEGMSENECVKEAREQARSMAAAKRIIHHRSLEYRTRVQGLHFGQ